jgi:hypothetical protein
MLFYLLILNNYIEIVALYRIFNTIQ